MKKTSWFILFFFILFVVSCKSGKTKNNPASTKTPSSAQSNYAENEDTQGPEAEADTYREDSEDTEGNQTTTMNVTLEPRYPTTRDDIKVILPEDFTGEINWYVNGEHIVGENDDTLPSSYFKRGDRVRVVAIDGNGKRYVAETKIYNANPVIEVRDSDFEIDDVLRYHVRVNDPDGDPVKIEVTEAPEGYSFDPGTETVTIPIPDKPGEYLITFKIKAMDDHGGWSEKKIAYRLRIRKETAPVEPIR